ncbi:MAG TPA: universal stress protein [Kineosporiaceae bacterium]|jgi:nucleotide-binding universal stress UspA family protein|nr:universal stress protein [Kineosporiaceae bacterium]
MPDTSIIAVGVDDTDSSHRALAWAAREAVRRHADLQVVTAWTWDAVEGAPIAAVDPQMMMDRAEDTQETAVREVIDDLPERPKIIRQIVQGTAADALIDASKHADLVVVGTHGRGPVRAFLLGSVSLSVIKSAGCPVVVMPPVPDVTPPSGRLTSASH